MCICISAPDGDNGSEKAAGLEKWCVCACRTQGHGYFSVGGIQRQLNLAQLALYILDANRHVGAGGRCGAGGSGWDIGSAGRGQHDSGRRPEHDGTTSCLRASTATTTLSMP
jgi:hypothetical protein